MHRYLRGIFLSSAESMKGFPGRSVGKESTCKKKNPLAMQETPVRFLGLEDPLEKG